MILNLFIIMFMPPTTEIASNTSDSCRMTYERIIENYLLLLVVADIDLPKYST